MDIPIKPEDWTKIIREDPDKILSLLTRKDVFKFIIEFNNRYLHWDQLRREKLPPGIDARHVWALMKMFRHEKYSNFKFNGFNFKYSLLANTLRRLHLLDKEAAGNLEVDYPSLTMRGRERYIINSLMEEAIASSQLEGAVTTRQVAKEMLRQNRKPRNYSEQMIVNGYKTLKMIRERKGEKLTKEFLLDIQKSITENTLKNKEDEGKFRDNNEIVVGDSLEIEKVYHRPPDYKDIPKLVEELCSFANNDDDEFIHPIIKGVILHFLIGYIHPFNDGNGRTARAIFYWYVISRGYWLFEYMTISRKILSSKVKYGLAYLYTETDENDLSYFIEYNMKVVYDALVDMRDYIKKQQKEQIESVQIVETLKNINFRQANILKDIMKHPNKYFTIKEIQESYRIVYQTARSDLLFLAQLGYITTKQFKNKFMFIFTEQNKKVLDSITKHQQK